MLANPTVLIIGAGASVDYHFPAGHVFQNRICALEDERVFLDELEEHGIENIREYLHRYVRSGYTSPDRYLEDNPDYITAGKFCIARVLKACEIEKQLYPPNGPDRSWYQHLFNTIYPGADPIAGKNHNLSIVTFNYDRSFEHYWWTTLQSRFRDQPEVLEQEWNSRPQVLHVHGQLGAYNPYDDSAVPYVNSTVIDDLNAAQRSIRIISEMNPEDEVFYQAEALLNEASRIHFLGFGYDRRNVHRLRYFPRERHDDIIITGTKTGIDNYYWGTIVDQVFEGGVNAASFDNSSIINFLSKPDVLV